MGVWGGCLCEGVCVRVDVCVRVGGFEMMDVRMKMKVSE